MCSWPFKIDSVRLFRQLSRFFCWFRYSDFIFFDSPSFTAITEVGDTLQLAGLSHGAFEDLGGAVGVDVGTV